MFDKQIDSYNCGIFALLFLFHIVYGIKLQSFSTTDLAIVRFWKVNSIKNISDAYTSGKTDPYLLFILLLNQSLTKWVTSS